MASFFGGNFFGGLFFDGGITPQPEIPTSIPDRPGHFAGQSSRMAKAIDAITLRRRREDEEFMLIMMRG